MLKHLIIQLCDSAVSFCHYLSGQRDKLIPLDTLEHGILWAIKQCIDIQVLYPKYKLPKEYVDFFEKHQITKITPEGCTDADVIILNGWNSVSELTSVIKSPVVLQSTYREFIKKHRQLIENLYKFTRLNIIFLDVNNFFDSSISEYEDTLNTLSNCILELYRSGYDTQLNLITDRMMLSGMNNCNAGIETVALAPDGKFYPCPAFYLNNSDSIGNLTEGLKVHNQKLYKLENAPICRICDAFHCKRCIWLNKKMTLEINTPSHQQCVMAHVERKVAKRLLDRIREFGDFAQDVRIPEIEYNDPIEKIIRKYD